MGKKLWLTTGFAIMLLLGPTGLGAADNPYQGSYQGAFKGNFSGDWTCTVEADGQINDLSVSIAPNAKGKGKVDAEGNLEATLRTGMITTIWTAKVTADLKIENGRTDRGGTFEGQGTRGQASAKQDPALKVILLGTGTPLPNPQRACAATLIVAGSKAFLIDTGRGFLNNLAAAGIRDVSTVLFTHYHSDHFGEFGELMVFRGIIGADQPLKVIGPAGAEKVVAAIMDAYALDSSYRKAHHQENWNETGVQVDVKESAPGVVYDDGKVRIRMFAVDHAPVQPAVGYRIDYMGRSVVVSGDTKKVPGLVEMAKGCDILVHDALNAEMVAQSASRLKDNPRLTAMNQDMAEYHATTIEVAEVARDAGVGTLVLTHLVPSIPVDEQAEQMFIRGMREIFGGSIVAGRDGMIIESGPAR